MNTETISYALEEGVATLTLNRPEVRNAISRALVDDFQTMLKVVTDTPEARVLILTGAGDKAFCAGADLKERAGMSPEEVEAFLKGLGDLLRRIAGLLQQGDGLGGDYTIKPL